MRPRTYREEQARLQEARKTAGSKILPSQRTKLQQVKQQGEALLQRMDKAQTDLNRHLDPSAQVQVNQASVPQMVPQDKPEAAYVGSAVARPVVQERRDFQLVAQRSRAALDMIEAQMQRRRSSVRSSAAEPVAEPAVAETAAEPAGERFNIVRAERLFVRLQKLQFMSPLSPQELGDEEVRVEVVSESVGSAGSVQVNLKSQRAGGAVLQAERLKAGGLELVERRGAVFIYCLRLEAIKELRYVESDSLRVQVASKTHNLVQKYPLVCRSPYQALFQQNQQSQFYCLKDTDAELLDTSSPVTAVADKAGVSLLIADGLQLTHNCVPIQVHLQMLVTGPGGLETHGVLQCPYIEQLEQNERLFEIRLRKAALVSKAVQSDPPEIEEAALEPLGQEGLSVDPSTGFVYYREGMETALRPPVGDYSVQPGQNNTASCLAAAPQVPSLLSKITQQNKPVETPTLFIKRIELVCLKASRRALESVSVKLGDTVIEIAKDVPVVAGSALLSNLLVTFQLDMFQISPLVIKADELTAVIPLAELRTKVSLDKWAPLAGGGRVGVLLNTLPPLCLNPSADQFTFVDENGKIIQNPYGVEPALQNDTEKIRMTASQIVQMYLPREGQNSSRGNEVNGIVQGLERLTSQLDQDTFSVSVEAERGPDVSLDNDSRSFSSQEQEKSAQESTGSEESEELEKALSRRLQERREELAAQAITASKTIKELEKSLGDSQVIQTMQAKKVARQVKEARNKKLLDVKYDLSSSSEDSDFLPKHRVPQTGKKNLSEFLKQKERDIFEDDSSTE